LTVGLGRLPAFDVVISEIHYHPPLSSDGDERYELIELRSLSDETVLLDGWALSRAVDFVFPPGATIAPSGYVVVARDPALVETAYGLSGVFGPFIGRLSNDDEIIELRNALGHLVDRAAYRDSDPWPENPDGLGPSLEKESPLANGEASSSWRASILLGGTPGRRNSTEVDRETSTLLAPGDVWRYRKGTSAPSSPVTAWTQLTFSDSAWSSGPSGFGYGDGDDATVLSDMRGSYTTVYLRRKLTLSDPSRIESLILSVAYDDAFVAYLNGSEVWRSASAGGTPGTPLAFNATAADLHAVADGNDTVDLALFPSLLVAGDNVVAIHALNEDIASSDLTLIPTLTLTEIDPSALIEPAHDVEINEVWAEPGGYVELYNEGAAAVDLSGWRLTASPAGTPAYEFPAGSSLASRAFTSVPMASLPFALQSQPQWLGLTTPDGRFVDGLDTRLQPPGRSFGRFPDGDGDVFVLDGPTPGSMNAYTPNTAVVIHEVQFHPPLAAETAEYLELFNRSAQPVSLFGWSLDKAVRYTFSSVSIPAGGYLVVSGSPALVQSRHGITGVAGPWRGKLANDADKIELKDPLGNKVDTVHYADDGSWPASTASSGPDGHGPSIELVHAEMESNHGSAWLASTGLGTPGAPNSRAAADPAPVIRSVAHDPPMPRSLDAVTITARVSDERSVSIVRVYSRTDGTGSFAQAAMLDDGLHGDGAAGDGTYGASLVKRSNGTIVQFYVEAVDGTAHTRRFPANAPTSVCLYQVDDRAYPTNLPLHRTVLKAADLNELESRSVDSDVLLPASFIRGKHTFYNVGLRYRGDNSRNLELKAFHLELNHDEPFEGVTNLNFNVEDSHLADLAADFIRRADVPVFETQPVSFTLNNAWQSAHGGLYLRVEAVDAEFLQRVFPGDDDGNLYRGRDPSGPGEADLRYLGPDPASYVTFYEKKTNSEQSYYGDIIALTDAFTNTPPADFSATMSLLLDVDEWLRYLAVETGCRCS